MDKEQKREYMKKWREKNKDKRREYNKKWYETNKEKQKEKHKEYNEENKERIKERRKEYIKTEKGYKSYKINGWKTIGLKDTDLDYIYDLYKNTTNCWVCNHDFSKNCKCMDHDHETGMFRQILCNKCNCHDSWKNYSEIV